MLNIFKKYVLSFKRRQNDFRRTFRHEAYGYFRVTDFGIPNFFYIIDDYVFLGISSLKRSNTMKKEDLCQEVMKGGEDYFVVEIYYVRA
jgi:hypothetical protein